MDVRHTTPNRGLPAVSPAAGLLALTRRPPRRYHPIREAEFDELVFSRVYDQRTEGDATPMASHRTAVLYLVLALGALLDLSKPPLSEEANRFFQLGRAALSVDSILESQSVPAIQALVRISRPPFYICAPRAD